MTAILQSLIHQGINKNTTKLEFFIIKNSNILMSILLLLTLILLIFSIAGIQAISNYLILFFVVVIWSSSILFSNYKENTILMMHLLYVGSIMLVMLCSFYIGFNVGFNLFFIVISVIPFVLFADKKIQYAYFFIPLLSFVFSLIYSYTKLKLINEFVFYIFLTNSLIAFSIQFLNIFLFRTKLADFIESASLHKNELSVFNQFFTKRLKEKTAKLVKENEKLNDQKEAAKSYAYHVSHDLREPLKNIISFIKITEKKADEIANSTLKAELIGYTKFVSQAAKRLDVFVSEALKLSLLDHQALLNFKEIDLNKNVRHVILSLNDLLQSSKATIRYNLPKKIELNTVQIEVLFQNLISNSIKYKSELISPIIDIKYTELENHYEFTYQDNGRGIPKDERKLVFEAFKVSSLNKQTDDSTGLGLSICKQIIEQHQGKIWIADSDKNEGTTFQFTIKKNLKNRG